ncbi:MAG: CNNM domain-containing protein [Candidatus Omnitrophica bacterium]|nr:CNNM domain-containing protein [Candidatus Omnitrophota bacterium]
MIYLYLLGCLGCVVLQGFFAASEISFISSRSLSLRHRQAKGDVRAKQVYQLILKPERFLATTLIGTNISVVISTSLLTFFMIQSGFENSNFWITFIFTPIVVIFAELIPKNIGRFFREDFSCQTVSLISFFEKLFLFLVKLSELSSRFLVRIFIKQAKYRSPFVTKEEIKSLVKEIESQGGIDRSEKEAIEDVFEFRSDKIKDTCVIFKKLIAFDYTDSYQRLLEIVRKNEFTRYPVLKNKEVVGYVNVYDLFYNPKKNWQEFIRPITKVGLNQKLHEIFNILQAKKEGIALVMKGGKPYGIVTIGNLIREVMTSIIK